MEPSGKWNHGGKKEKFKSTRDNNWTHFPRSIFTGLSHMLRILTRSLLTSRQKNSSSLSVRCKHCGLVKTSRYRGHSSQSRKNGLATLSYGDSRSCHKEWSMGKTSKTNNFKSLCLMKAMLIWATESLHSLNKTTTEQESMWTWC